jgi:hypothetical protein
MPKAEGRGVINQLSNGTGSEAEGQGVTRSSIDTTSSKSAIVQ